MAENTWLGRAAAQSQKTTLTVAGTWAANDTYVITIGGAALTLTIGALTATTDVANAIKAMIAGESALGTETRNALGNAIPQFAELTATVSGSVVTLTGPAGKPFTVGSLATTAGNGDVTAATAQAATGPNHADNVLNWSTGSLPGAGDTVYLRNTSASILYGLTGITGTLTAVYIDSTFTGYVGLSEINPAGYQEYRTKDWTIDVTSLIIGAGDGPGSSRLRINTGSVATAIQVYKTANGSNGVPALLLSGSNAANTFELHKGSAGMAFYGESTTQFVTIRLSGGSLQCGVGATLSGATVTMTGSSKFSAITNVSAITQNGGSAALLGAATLGTLTLIAGVFRWLSSGTITAATVGGGASQATIDATEDASARTVTTLTLKPKGMLRHTGQVTITTPVVDSTVRELRAA